MSEPIPPVTPESVLANETVVAARGSSQPEVWLDTALACVGSVIAASISA